MKKKTNKQKTKQNKHRDNRQPLCSQSCSYAKQRCKRCTGSQGKPEQQWQHGNTRCSQLLRSLVLPRCLEQPREGLAESSFRSTLPFDSVSSDGVPASRCSPESTEMLRSRFTLPFKELKFGTAFWLFFSPELPGEI